MQYADYAVWQREWVDADSTWSRRIFKGALRGPPEVLKLPADHARPAHRDYAGTFEELVLGKELTAGLKELGRRHGTTLHITLLNGVGGAVYQGYRGNEDIVDWYAGGKSNPCGDRGSDWVFCKHTGGASVHTRGDDGWGITGTNKGSNHCCAGASGHSL